jgi:hypothetical protein
VPNGALRGRDPRPITDGERDLVAAKADDESLCAGIAE